MPTNTEDPYELGDPSSPSPYSLGELPPQADEFGTPIQENYATAISNTPSPLPTVKSSYKRKHKSKQTRPTLHFPPELTNVEVKTAEELGHYSSAALKIINPDRTGMYLTVKNMYYRVPDKKKQMKTILHDMSFYLRPGMMTLVLGSPGGGRTSLFKVLAHATPKHTMVEGEVLFNNRPADPATHHLDVSCIITFYYHFPSHCTKLHITQADNHLPLLTVRETLWFSSQCNLPPNIPEEMRNARLETLLNILGLKKVENTYIGNEFVRGVSGGQKKRVTIGIDMLKGSNIYLLDEPTTGLDSVTSYEVLNCVKALATNGTTSVMCALLQPPREVFDLFDHVLLINEGRISYFGAKEDAVPYFQRLGFNPHEGMNPAEFLQEVVNVPEDFVEEQPPPLVTAQEFADAYKTSDEYAHTMEIVSNPTEMLLPDTPLNDHMNDPPHVNGFWKQLELCMWRSSKITLRNKAPIIARNLKIVLIAIILGTVFLNLDTNQSSVAQRQGLLYFSLLTITFGSLITIRDLYDQRPIFYEQRNLRKWYTTLPFFISYITPELILGGIETVVFSVTMYWLADLRSGSARFVFFLLILYLTEIFGASLITLVAALTPSSVYASTFVPSLLLLLILASGFLVPGTLIPGWWIWFFWASPLKWAFEGLTINEFSNLQLMCDADEYYPLPNTPNIAQFGGQQVCPITNGNQPLTVLGFDTRLWYRWVDLAVLFGFSLGLLFLAFLVLKFKDQQPSSGPGVTQAEPRKRLRKKHRRLNQPQEKDPHTHVSVLERIPGLEITGTYLTFKNLSYYVPAPKTNKKENPPQASTDAQGNVKNNERRSNELQLLYNITIYVKPGVLVALMGPSGAGKSTLLDVLADRKNVGRITGEILIDGKPRDQFFTRYSAYVTQSDILFPTSTVREAITFSAINRLPEGVPRERKLEFVNEVLYGLKLNDIANRVIGSGQSGLSLEQRKRVNIGVELAANPQMIFLDEPTSGLDSAGARKVMKLTKKLAQQGRTIVCTIHQPSAEIFKLFDNLLLLSPGGKTVYFGPIGENGCQFLEYCSHLGYYMEEGKNLADFVLEFATATSHAPDKEAMEANEIIEKQHSEYGGTCDKNPTLSGRTNLGESQSFYSTSVSGPYCRLGDDRHIGSKPKREQPRSLEELVESYNESDMQRNAIAEIDSHDFIPAEFKPRQFNDKYATSFGTQLRENLKRSLTSFVLRRRVEFLFQVMRTLVLGIFLGTIFIELGLDQTGIRNRVSHIFFSCTFAGFVGFSLIPAVVQERGVFYHEQSSGTYRPATYGLALCVATIPMIIAATIAYTVPAYWIPTMDPSHAFHRFLFFVFVFFLVTLAIVSLAQFLAVAMPTEGIAVMFLGIIVPIFTLFAGFLIPRPDIPGWWIWAYWISFLHYSVEAMLVNLFSSFTFHCNPDQYFIINGIPYCPYIDGNDVISQYGYYNVWKWIDVGVLAGIYGIMVFLICLSLAKIRHAKT